LRGFEVRLRAKNRRIFANENGGFGHLPVFRAGLDALRRIFWNRMILAQINGARQKQNLKGSAL